MFSEGETSRRLTVLGGYDLAQTVQDLCSSKWFGLLVGAVAIGLCAFGSIFVILSQPYRLSRILKAVLPLNGSPDLLGGSVLELGAILLYLLLLTEIIRRLAGHESLRSEPWAR